MLFTCERHEQLIPIDWNAEVASREIQEIIRDTEAAFLPHAWWPHHPLDENPENAASNKTLYMGAAGVMWALEFLAARQSIALSHSYENLWYTAWQNYQSLANTGTPVPSWFVGESALLLLCMLRGPKAQKISSADRLYQAISANIENPTWEIFWGSPGTMLAALFAFESTKDLRWLELYKRSAERLWHEWIYCKDLDCYVWTQDLYGKKKIIFGAGHGFAGNAFALLRGKAVFSDDSQRTLVTRVVSTTKRLAVQVGGFANWPVSNAEHTPSAEATLVQWCHGSPGFILTLARHVPVGDDQDFDQLLLKAGELIWKAGPLVKGACFCHGTDGNGMALLSLFQRTKNKLWLDRARFFAAQALQQSRQNLKTYGRRRYTLWTGDLGLAVFLQAAIDTEAHMPTLDFI